MPQEPILVASGISKRYRGVAALSDAGFELRRGEILGLCGENGAGKSTLIKILGGIVTPDDGSLSIDGTNVDFGHRPDPFLLSIVHQELSIIPHLSVLDNIMIGRVGAGKGFYFRHHYEAETRELLQRVGLDHVAPSTLAGKLTLAEQQLVEIARGLASRARVLLLDEPTATLSDAEISKVFAVLRELQAQGTSMVIVSHRLVEIFDLTDRITVFRNGRHIFTRRTAELDAPELVRAMIGRNVEHNTSTRRFDTDGDKPPRLRAQALAVPDSFGPVDVDIHEGEVVAIVGQLGSGADNFLKTLAGLQRPQAGSLMMDGQRVTLDSVADAYRHGIAYVAEDRAGRGVFLAAGIEVNLTSQILGQISPMGLVSPKLSRTKALELAEAFQIDPSRLGHAVATLSGGNQQKVSLAKAAATTPRLLLLNEPTRGVDVGARAEIYSKLRAMAEDGLSVAFYSTDLDEVLEVADRIVTFYRGKLVRSLERAAANADEILKDILHGRPEVSQ